MLMLAFLERELRELCEFSQTVFTYTKTIYK
jgi:hypothetical protein